MRMHHKLLHEALQKEEVEVEEEQISGLYSDLSL
jgi:hypothetical protein